MTTPVKEENAVVLKFGGGLHTRATEDEIDIKECSDGFNFDLDLENRDFRPRNAFDLAGTAPNAGEIRGFVNLFKADGTSKLMVQAGSNLYEWDGSSTFTLRQTVASSAKLRGRLDSNWQLSDKVIITDLNLQEPVMEWDGTTIQDVSFLSNPSTAFPTTFKAKYGVVRNERAIFANIEDGGTAFPHLIVGSKRSDYTTISVSDRPSSALSDADPFFLVSPDNRAINGMTDLYGTLITSSKQGSIFKLTGSSAKDFAMDELFFRSFADGDEALTNVGNDVFYGRPGRVESLIATDRFGDVEADDLTAIVQDKVSSYKNWTIVYNNRTQRAYCWPGSQNEVWVYHKPLQGGPISPWMKWTTQHVSALQPTAAMNMIDPSDGLEYIYWGDASGNIYKMEGTGTSGDSGDTNVKSERLSGLFSAPLDAQAYEVEGWVKYRKLDTAVSLTMRIEYSGMNVFNETINFTLPIDSNRSYYNGTSYYNDGTTFYGSFSQRLHRQKFVAPGKGNEFQVRLTVNGTATFNINEVGLRFKQAS